MDGVDGPSPGRGGVMIVGMVGIEVDDGRPVPVPRNDLLGVDVEADEEVDRGVFIVILLSSDKGKQERDGSSVNAGE